MIDRQRKLDVQINGGMGLYTFVPLTRKAQVWVKRHVDLESWQWLGAGFAVDGSRYANDLAGGMIEAGLRVA